MKSDLSKPTIHDVADRAGVSASTVSNVLNRTGHVHPKTRERVLQAMHDLHYHRNGLAHSLPNRRTFTLGVVLPNNANPYFAQILLGMEAACFDLGYNLILGNANEDTQRELAYIDVLLARQVDGLLLVSTGAFHETLQHVAQHETPLVIVDRTPGYQELDTVFTDNEHGGLLATRHLIKLGHQRIGCIIGPPLLALSKERLHGYRRALAGAGIKIDDTLVAVGDFDYASGYQACRQLLHLPNPPTAIFACNDLMAVGAIYAINEAGLRVPADISIIGYDDIPITRYTVPPLTTIAQPAQQTGRVAVEMLVKRLQAPSSPVQYRRLPVQLVERESCAPRKQADDAHRLA